MGILVPMIWSMASVSFTTIDEIRSNFSKMVHDKALCEKSILYLQASADTSVLHLGYLGSLETIWANHVSSPISKLKTFTKGKEKIEKAIQIDPTNPELRFIRLSIQQNIPSFLGYQQHIKEDIAFLKQHRNRIQSKVIQNYLDILLKQ